MKYNDCRRPLVARHFYALLELAGDGMVWGRLISGTDSNVFRKPDGHLYALPQQEIS